MFQDIFLLISSIGFFIWTARSLYRHVVFFQTLPHSFLYPKQNKFIFIFSSLFSFMGILSWFVLALSFYMTVTDLSTLYVQALIASLFALKIAIVIREAKKQQFLSSYLYPRAVILLISAFFCMTLLFFYPLTIHIIWILLLERMTFIVALLLLFLFGFPTELLDDVAIKKAAQKMRSLRSSTKILVLGGQGDEIAWMIQEIVSSSKDILNLPAQILTRGELARQILKIKNSREIILLPINSQNTYLSKIALEIFSPEICVVSPSFLSQENNVLNVRSLSESFDKKTKIILPVEYERPAQLFLKKNTVSYYSTQKDLSLNKGVYVEDIVYKRSGIQVSVALSAQTLLIESNSTDRDFVDFIVPSVIVARLLHVPMKEVHVFAAKAVYPSTMFSLTKTKKRAIIFNGIGVSSVDKIIRQIEYLKIFGSNTIVIIGKLSLFTTKKELLALGSALNEIAGSVILLQQEYLRPLRAGMKDAKGNSKIVCLSIDQASGLMNSSGSRDKILLLGSQTESLYRQLHQST